MTLLPGRDGCARRFEFLTFRAFGLRLHCNTPISALPAVPSTCSDVTVRLEPEACWPDALQRAPRQLRFASRAVDARGEAVLTVWTVSNGALLHIRYSDGTEFLVDTAGTRVWATWPAALTVEDACAYLLGPVLGLVLRLRGITCLHASAIDVEGQAVAIVGPPGSGKSTTAAIFARSGFGILSDDLVALDDRGSAVMVQPAYPRLGLWADSVEALFGSRNALPAQTPTWNKRYLALTGGYTFQPAPLPLRAIYVLGDRVMSSGAPYIEAPARQNGLTQLLENTYVSYLLDRTMSARDFDLLARLVSKVPVRRLVPHVAHASTSALREVILRDLDAVRPVRESPPVSTAADKPGSGPAPATYRGFIP